MQEAVQWQVGFEGGREGGKGEQEGISVHWSEDTEV